MSIRLVLSDIDGTLVTSDKTLTPRAIHAVQQLHEVDIMFAIASARPAQGLRRFVEPLAITTPLNALNGGLGVDTSMEILYSYPLDTTNAHSIIDEMLKMSMSVWVYQNTNWFVLDELGAHVQHESGTSNLAPTVVTSFDIVGEGIIKIVGVCDDLDRSRRAFDVMSTQFELVANVTASQPYYLDITAANVNKGSVVAFLAEHYGLSREEIVTIGDMSNDVAMFEQSGTSIAMGNAHSNVQLAATHVTASNDNEGFATAMENFVLV